MTSIRSFIDLVESAEHESVVPVLYHGTCPANAARLVENGWAPKTGERGANMGQSRFLYLSTGREDALWFAEQKGCNTVVEVRDVPLGHLLVDPEDGSWDTLEDELAERNGLPGKVVLTKPLLASHFHLSGGVVESAGRESASVDGTTEALAFIEQAARKFGRERLAGGNCGTFALALAVRLKELGFAPTLAFIFRVNEDCDSDDINDVVAAETDIYHVVTMLGDRMFDATGETNAENLIAIASHQYRDGNPGFFRDVALDDRAMLSLIEHDTNWSVTAGAFGAAMKTGKKPTKRRTT